MTPQRRTTGQFDQPSGNEVADVLRDVWDSFRNDREGFIDYLLDSNRSGLRVDVAA